MATLVLSAAGAAIGGAVGGTVLGLSSAVIGKAIGATIGSAIDQRLLGTGSATVSVGKLNALRLQSASEGAALPRVFGRMRVAGNVIWSTRFLETKKQSGGGKGNPRKVVSYSYSVSLAIALCEGEVTRIGKVWADGNEISLNTINWRLVPGTETQMPDPLIQAIEGVEDAPAYRGVAYIVFEDLDLGPFGNRVPQFNVEVIRKAKQTNAAAPIDPYDAIRAIALVPGSGEYALATTPVRFDLDKGVSKSANVNTAAGIPDIDASLNQLDQELPNVESVSLVVSWFGDDLRCGQCSVRPCVEQTSLDPAAMPWQVNGVNRASAAVVSQIDGRPAFGGTPTDASVLEAIQRIKASGQEVMFYPFVMMDIPAGNGKPDPWTGGVGQPVYPWRGRITLDIAPGVAGSVDQTAAAVAQVSAFFGSAQPGDFVVSGGMVSYTGPTEWSYRRFVLHYAHLCALAGTVDTFVIGSEMRSLTSVRGTSNLFPAVAELITLAADVRAILGPLVKISYAADWSEYFGHHPADGSGDVFFHLDPLWADANIDFVGIDNYMPLSDWRDTADHLDQGFRSPYNLDYLKANVAGGEGFDWFYVSQADRDAQIRSAITDGAYGEDWVFRYKDLKAWWAMPHHNRPGGARDPLPTNWVPQSKPIWFTEYGCPAIDKGTNQPNVFFDPKSAESQIPQYSTQNRDDFIQYRYLQAHAEHWSNPQENPVSAIYGLPMVDTSRMHVWAWDARPWPDFPNRIDIWSDGDNYGSGHWISGRTGLAPLSAIVSEIAERANFSDYDVSQLYGAVHGYLIQGIETPRQSLQPLMLSHAFDGLEYGGVCSFKNRVGIADAILDNTRFVPSREEEPIALTRSAVAESGSSVQISYYHADNDYQTGMAQAGFAEANEPVVNAAELPIALDAVQGAQTADRWLTEAHIARDTASFALAPSRLDVTVGDVLDLSSFGAGGLFRVDRIEEAGARRCEATRIEAGVYLPGRREDDSITPKVFALPAPAYIEFLDLPVLDDGDLAHAPLVASAGIPWLGPKSVYVAASDNGYTLNTQITDASTVGTLQSGLPQRSPDQWSFGTPVDVSLPYGELFAATDADVLNGANLAAVRNQGDKDWEVLQFRDADLIGPGLYRIDGFLRGQFGTEFAIPVDYLPGADFVLLDGSAAQIDLAVAERGLEKHYRIGPVSRPYSDGSYVHVMRSFDGVGLRPYKPVHLRAMRRANGDVSVNWTRRTRLDGDSWAGVDVPLAEEREDYILRIEQNTTLVRELILPTPGFTYAATDQVADGIAGPFDITVAQISVQFGPGPFERIAFNG